MKSCPTCQATYPNSYAVCPQDGTPLVEGGAWAPGSVVRGKYRILSKIGQGGMGAVYKALHVNFEEERALKVISAELLSDAAAGLLAAVGDDRQVDARDPLKGRQQPAAAEAPRANPSHTHALLCHGAPPIRLAEG